MIDPFTGRPTEEDPLMEYYKTHNTIAQLLLKIITLQNHLILNVIPRLAISGEEAEIDAVAKELLDWEWGAYTMDEITLTREKVREAMEDWISVKDGNGFIDYTCFWIWSETCDMNTDFCRLCKRLTEFAKGEVLSTSKGKEE